MLAHPDHSRRRRTVRQVIYQAAAPPAGPTVYVQDTFSGLTGSSLDSHPPDICPVGSAWVSRSGAFKLHNDTAAISADTDLGHATINTGVSDCVIRAAVKTHSLVDNTARASGLVLRWTNTSNYWRAAINAAGDRFYLIQRTSGVDTVRASATVTIESLTTWYTLEATLNGAALSATLDGANPIAYASATQGQANTEHGINCRKDTTGAGGDQVDNFTVEALP